MFICHVRDALIRFKFFFFYFQISINSHLLSSVVIKITKICIAFPQTVFKFFKLIRLSILQY